MRGIGDASDQRGQQQHAGYGGELQFADLPQPFGLVLLALLVGSGFVVAAAARVVHRLLPLVLVVAPVRARVP